MTSVLAYTSSPAAGWDALDRQVRRMLDLIGGPAHLRDIAALLPGVPARHIRESLHGFVRAGDADFGPEGWSLRPGTVVHLSTTARTLKAA